MALVCLDRESVRDFVTRCQLVFNSCYSRDDVTGLRLSFKPFSHFSRFEIHMRLFQFVLAATLVFSGCSNVQSPPVAVVSASDIEWEQLNPARGDNSPKAATLWGDRNGRSPTGFLVKFAEGFSSPPHIHNVSYRGVVISGLIHNDDPNAANMWMPKASFWTQPKGEVHITSAKGITNVAYIEIDEGPYLVRPPTEAFDSGERPINVDASNLVWLELAKDPSVKVAYLWGVPKEGSVNGTLVAFPAGFAGVVNTADSTFRAVAIQGKYKYGISNGDRLETMTAGSYFSSTKAAAHFISCEAEESCIFYVRTLGKYTVATE